MIGVKGADPFGMSVPLLDAGYDVRLLTCSRKMIDPDLWRSRLQEYRFTAEDKNLAIFGIAENRKRALARGLSVSYSRLTVERVAEAFIEGFIPMSLVHMGVVHNQDIPHWVVVTDIEDDRVVFNDPYPPRGGKNICLSRKEFQIILDDVGTRIGLSPSTLFIRNCKQ